MNRFLASLIAVLFLLACSPDGDTRSDAPPFSTEGRTVAAYTTAADSDLRLTPTAERTFEAAHQPLETEVFVVVNPHHTFQTFLGIGGAITDASAEVFATLSPEQQKRLLTAYYDSEEGIGYSLLRTNIHSCDFSSASYTYIEEGDSALASFDIAPDRQYRIPLIKRAIAAAGGSLTLYASPWSPPAFMKDNNHMLRGGKLLPEYRDPWARYFTKFIQAYEAEGIPVWGITIQNEPMATQTWESCIFTAEEERDFLKNHLGPAMHAAGLGDRKIIVWDHNRDLLVHRASTILDDPAAAQYAWGVGFHWYEPWAGGEPMYDNLGAVAEAYPDVNLIFTEGCYGGFDPAGYQDWSHAEGYGESMINDFNNGTVGWTDWNILLDERGGPNHVGNFCFAPVHANTNIDKLIFRPPYYYIGHFSKFIRPGAVRVSTAVSRSHLLATSFRNPDGTMATVVMNRSEEEISYKVFIGDQAVEETLPAHAIQTLLY